ncbi:unnamed protein product [Lasius platythorax]|uniref:Secreted protein n=1 Tax=Lasius platythorax TaxID=488582 RepID=A0AAV2P8G2_9HYME
MCRMHSLMRSLRAMRMYCFITAIRKKLIGPIILILVSRSVSTRMVPRVHGTSRKHIRKQLITDKITQLIFSVVVSQSARGHAPIGFRNQRFSWML